MRTKKCRAQKHAHVVIAGKDLHSGPSLVQDAKHPEQAEIARPLVETITANDEQGLPSRLRQLQGIVFGPGLLDAAGGNQRSDESVGIGVKVGEEKNAPLRPFPGPLIADVLNFLFQ